MKMKNIVIMLSLALMLQLSVVQANETRFDPNGDDEYKLIFVNAQGLVNNIPFLTNEGGIFKYGTDDRDLVFLEGKIVPNGTTNDQDFTIGYLDYFVLSNNGLSHVMRYGNYDVQNNELRFEDMATGATILVTFSTTSPVIGTLGVGDLNIGGTTYKVYVANTTSGIPPLAVDMNANGLINSEPIDLYLETGESIVVDAIRTSGGDWNSASQTWSNIGTVINSNQTIVKLFTPEDTFGQDLPMSNLFVDFVIEAQSSQEINLVSVSGIDANGTTFSLSGTSQFTTYFGETFDMNDAYYPSTVRIIPPSEDNEAPEFLVRYDNATKDIVVDFVDNSNGMLTSTFSGMSLWNGYELHMYEVTDVANNSAYMELVYKQEGKHTKVHLLSLRYNNNPIINLISNKLDVKIINGKLDQELTVLPDYEASVIYYRSNNESKISYRDVNNLNIYRENGPVILELQTNRGDLEYEALTL